MNAMDIMVLTTRKMSENIYQKLKMTEGETYCFPFGLVKYAA